MGGRMLILHLLIGCVVGLETSLPLAAEKYSALETQETHLAFFEKQLAEFSKKANDAKASRRQLLDHAEEKRKQVSIENSRVETANKLHKKASEKKLNLTAGMEEERTKAKLANNLMQSSDQKMESALRQAKRLKTVARAAKTKQLILGVKAATFTKNMARASERLDLAKSKSELMASKLDSDSKRLEDAKARIKRAELEKQAALEQLHAASQSLAETKELGQHSLEEQQWSAEWAARALATAAEESAKAEHAKEAYRGVIERMGIKEMRAANAKGAADAAHDDMIRAVSTSAETWNRTAKAVRSVRQAKEAGERAQEKILNLQKNLDATTAAQKKDAEALKNLEDKVVAKQAKNAASKKALDVMKQAIEDREARAVALEKEAAQEKEKAKAANAEVKAALDALKSYGITKSNMRPKKEKKSKKDVAKKRAPKVRASSKVPEDVMAQTSSEVATADVPLPANMADVTWEIAEAHKNSPEMKLFRVEKRRMAKKDRENKAHQRKLAWREKNRKAKEARLEAEDAMTDLQVEKSKALAKQEVLEQADEAGRMAREIIASANDVTSVATIKDAEAAADAAEIEVSNFQG